MVIKPTAKLRIMKCLSIINDYFTSTETEQWIPCTVEDFCETDRRHRIKLGYVSRSVVLAEHQLLTNSNGRRPKREGAL